MTAPVEELTASGLGYVRAGRAILTDVSLTAYAGSAVAVTGPSGSGKSSLLALLAGLERPTTGEVQLGGVAVRPGDPAQRRRYGLILQGYGLVSVLTAAENVELVLQARSLPAREVIERARAALDRVRMAEVADHLVEELSGGQQQRVAVARALVAEPEVILADEPTAELDAGNRQLVLGLLLDESRRGRIVVLASHDREVADACDRELHLVDGRLQDEASVVAHAEPPVVEPSPDAEAPAAAPSAVEPDGIERDEAEPDEVSPRGRPFEPGGADVAGPATPVLEHDRSAWRRGADEKAPQPSRPAAGRTGWERPPAD